MDRFQARLDSLAATILMDEGADTTKKESDVSEDSVHLSVKRNHRKPRREVHLQDDLFDSDLNHSSSTLSSGSSDSEDGRRQSRVSRARLLTPLKGQSAYGRKAESTSD